MLFFDISLLHSQVWTHNHRIFNMSHFAWATMHESVLINHYWKTIMWALLHELLSHDNLHLLAGSTKHSQETKTLVIANFALARLAKLTNWVVLSVSLEYPNISRSKSAPSLLVCSKSAQSAMLRKYIHGQWKSLVAVHIISVCASVRTAGEFCTQAYATRGVWRFKHRKL